MVAAVEDAGFCPVIKRPSTIAKLCQSGGLLIAAAQSLQLILDKERYNVGEMYSVLFAVDKVRSRDKPLKYPHIFRAGELVLLNKIDLLPHVDFDVRFAVANARAVNPDITVLHVSTRTGEGLDGWYAWLLGAVAAAREATFT